MGSQNISTVNRRRWGHPGCQNCCFQAGWWVCRVSLSYGFHVSLTTHGHARTCRRAHTLAIEHEPIDTGNRTGAPASLDSPVRRLGEEDSSILLQTEGDTARETLSARLPPFFL